MWRSNVFRLRKCPSAATRRNARCYSLNTSLPVRDEEFWEALRSISQGSKHKDGSIGRTEFSPVQRLGFAISGGVDSMALAALYADCKSSRHFMPQAHAFIVDHKVRPESTEEAEWVAEQCRSKFGMQASVLPLSWPADFDPRAHKRFETDARTLRYQALGRACRAANITSLLVAHHADDQAETVLMRLANNRLRSGLQAMQPIEWIPECHGIHGVSHSGATPEDHISLGLKHMPFPIERGGVHILRPLLGFEKSRLIATCEQSGVAWAEDKTNHLQTYTSRNAVRHVLKTHELPAALSVRSLMDVSLSMQKRVNWHKLQAKKLLDKCPMKLDLQAGSLLVRFPPFKDLLDRPIENQSDLNSAKNTAFFLLERVGQLIAPRESRPLSELAATVANIWPDFLELEQTDSSQTDFSSNPTNYCVYNVWWRTWDKPSPFSKSRGASARPHSHEWLLSRQPIEHHRAGATSRGISYPPAHTLSLTQGDPATLQSGVSDTFLLFDSRWWIQLHNHTADVLVLRLFTREDLRHIPSLHDAKRTPLTGAPHPERFIATALSLLKPAELRFTLPAVFRRDSVTQEETLIGFPTLNVSMGCLGYPEHVCSWQVRYKKIELPASKLKEIITPGVTHAMIKKEMAKFVPKHMKLLQEADEKAVTRSVQSRRRGGQDQPAQESGGAQRRTLGSKATVPGRRIPLVPVAESQRHGKSEKREGGGYNIKWADFKDRFN